MLELTRIGVDVAVGESGVFDGLELVGSAGVDRLATVNAFV